MDTFIDLLYQKKVFHASQGTNWHDVHSLADQYLSDTVKGYASALIKGTSSKETSRGELHSRLVNKDSPLQYEFYLLFYLHACRFI